MIHLVFSQGDGPCVDVAALARGAERFFEASLQSIGQTKPEVGVARTPLRLCLRLRRPAEGSAELELRVRRACEADYRAADLAEARGQAAGMAALARRCPWIWELHSSPHVHEGVLLTACAILASAALGPVLPPDGSTLLGVRSARQRADRLLR